MKQGCFCVFHPATASTTLRAPNGKFKFKAARPIKRKTDGKVIICWPQRLAQPDRPGHIEVYRVRPPLNSGSSLTAAQVRGHREDRVSSEDT